MLLTSDLRHAGFAPARAACCRGAPLWLYLHFPLALSPSPFSSLLSPCWGHPKLISCSGMEWGTSVEILLSVLFSVKCSSCSLVVLFSEHPLPDPSPLSLIPALHSCTKMSVMLQERPPPGGSVWPRRPLTGASSCAQETSSCCSSNWLARGPARAHLPPPPGLWPAHALSYMCARHKSSQGFW